MSYSGPGGAGVASGFLLFMAVLQLALGGLFVFLALTVPFVGEGMFIGAAVFFIVGVVLLVIAMRVRTSQANARRIAAEGIAGQATITALTQTGMYLNNNPQVKMDLLVELAGREPYPASRKEFVPLIMLARLMSGAPLPVKVDRADPQQLIIEWSRAGMAAAPPASGTAVSAASGMAGPAGSMPVSNLAVSAAGQSASSMDESLSQVQAALQSSGVPVGPTYATPDQGSYTTEQLRTYLREQGVAASVRIDQVMDMGQIVGDERLYTMQVTLEMPGVAPEQLKPSAAMVPLTAVPKVKVGWRIPVRVAADNHQLLMFEWEKV